MTPQFSVVIPTFGARTHLREAVGSVLGQSCGDFECIVVDDASDESIDLPADARITLIRREANGGPAAARNTGVAAAQGRYLAFLDDDDVWLPQRLEHAARGHLRAPVVVCGQGTLGAESAPRVRRLEANVAGTILDDIVPHVGATTIERDGAPAFDERYRTCEDVEWWLRVAADHAVTTEPVIALLYRAHTRTSGADRQRIDDGRQLLAQHADYFATHPRARAFRLKRMGLSALRAHDRRLALRCLGESLRFRPEPRTAWHALRALMPDTGASHA